MIISEYFNYFNIICSFHFIQKSCYLGRDKSRILNAMNASVPECEAVCLMSIASCDNHYGHWCIHFT